MFLFLLWKAVSCQDLPILLFPLPIEIAKGPALANNILVRMSFILLLSTGLLITLCLMCNEKLYSWLRNLGYYKCFERVGKVETRTGKISITLENIWRKLLDCFQGSSFVKEQVYLPEQNPLLFSKSLLHPYPVLLVSTWTTLPLLTLNILSSFLSL